MFHLGLLAASLLVLPILPSAWWKETTAAQPALRILALLAATVGLPYFTLSSTGPLLQTWYTRLNSGKMPYRLYALSNLGSLLALLSYPAIVEPLLRSSSQAVIWSIAYGVFVLLCGAVAVTVLRSAGLPEVEAAAIEPDTPSPSLSEHLLWIALAAIPSALLMAVTNHLSTNIAPIPLLWVVPLALYLITLVVCFESDRWYQRLWGYPMLLIFCGAMTWYLIPDSNEERLEVVLPVFLVGLLVCCLACHGELARRRPAPRYLTSFYLMLSVGGALGGLFVGLLAPVIFRSFLELPISLLACVILIGFVLFQDRLGLTLHWRMAAAVPALLVSLALVYRLTIGEKKWLAEQRVAARNFYGALTVSDRDDGKTVVRYLVHGTIQHGAEVLQGQFKGKPVAYYGPNSGVGIAVEDRQLRGPIRLGVIGLGAGALAGYGRAGDWVRFYELNPLVVEIAQTEFSYLRDTKARLDLVMGDARRSLETEPPQNFDVLAVDAFSSDAIPVHLLTQEAFREYFRHMKPDGILAVHISNRYLSLEWVVRLEAQALGKQALLVTDGTPAADDPVMNESDWVLVSSDPHAFDAEKWRKLGSASPRPAGLKLWTDDYSNLLGVLNKK
jgi:SAM-dependent methyltransferase